MRLGSCCSLPGLSQPGGGKELSNSDLIHLVFHSLAEQTGTPEGDCTRLITFVPDRSGRYKRYALESRAAIWAFGWQPSKTLAGGLAGTLIEILPDGVTCRG